MDAAPIIAAPEATVTTSLEPTSSISLPAIASGKKASVITAPQIAAFKRNAIRTP
jgi:hypothetical protein